MQEMENPSLEQIRVFLDGNQEVRFQGKGRGEIYAWVDRTLRQQDYPPRSRIDKGLLRRYPSKMTGLSRAQMGRPIGEYSEQDRPASTDPVPAAHVSQAVVRHKANRVEGAHSLPAQLHLSEHSL